MFSLKFLLFLKLISGSKTFRPDRCSGVCVSKLETLTLENGFRAEKGLVRVKSDEEEKEFCAVFGMIPLQDQLSDIAFNARDFKRIGRHPICQTENQNDYYVQWRSSGKIGCTNACHASCSDGPCNECESFCGSKDARCCSGWLFDRTFIYAKN